MARITLMFQILSRLELGPFLPRDLVFGEISVTGCATLTHLSFSSFLFALQQEFVKGVQAYGATPFKRARVLIILGGMAVG